MRFFHDLRNKLMSQPLGLVATDPGLTSLGGGARVSPRVSPYSPVTAWSPLPRAPLYLFAALALGLVLVAALPHGGDAAVSLNQLEWQARQGDADAQLLLGLAYRDGGHGLKPDARAGTAWIARAARGGNAYAAGLLGDAYAQGTGVALDRQRAKYWWRQAARGGNRHGAARLGQAPAPGLARLWGINDQSGESLKRRAREGDPVAQFQLAMRYRDGAWGVDADPRLARGWLEQSARHGNPVAMRALAAAYARGDLGLAADAARAARWRRRAELSQAQAPDANGRS